MKPHRGVDGERSLAVFIDFENMGLGFNNRRDRFEINKVLERLVEKGKIVAKKAYADWSRFGMYTGGLHEAAIELVEIPRRGMSGKNSADIRLVVDAIDLAYSKDHIDTFVIVSGDSDFSPLVSKLKELGKHVIGLGLVDATSDLLRDNCDEFIYYEDLDRAPIIPVAMNEQFPERKRKVFSLMLDSLLALRRENKEVIYSSMLKDTMKRKKPSFNEEYYGYRTFSELLEDAQREGLLVIEKHKTSGMYVVSRFGLEMSPGVVASLSSRNGPEPRKALDVGRPPAIAPTERIEKREPVRPRLAERPAPAPASQVQQVPVEPAPARPPVTIQPPQILSAVPEEEPETNKRLLGRALAEEIDDLDDDLDQIPSYTPAKAKAPPKPRASTPAKSKADAPARPARKAPAKSPRASGGREKRESKPVAAPEPSPVVSRPAPVELPTPKPAPIPKPAPAPKPVVTEDDEFGAGLEE